MSKIYNYLSIVDPTMLVLVLIGIAVISNVVPRDKRWLVPFVFGPMWMLANRCGDFNVIGSYLKVLTSVPILYLIYGVWTHPHRRNVPIVGGTLLIGIGLLWILCIATTRDAGYGFATRFQWLLMCIAAILLPGVALNGDNLKKMLIALFWGNFAAAFLMLAAVALDPRAMNLNGHTRFSPWGANPNQINMTLTMAFFSSLYMIQNFKSDKRLPVYSGTAIASAMMLLLTLSRSSIAMAVIGAAILAPTMLSRRPLISVLVLCVTILVTANYVSSKGISLTRLNSIESGRGEIALQYLQEIKKRPASGLLGVQNKSFQNAGSRTSHAHNAIVLIAYNGGLLLLVPVAWLVYQAGAACLYLYRNKRRWPELEVEIRWIASVFFALTASSVNNFAIIWSSYFESFLVLGVAMLALSFKRTGGATLTFTDMPSIPEKSFA